MASLSPPSLCPATLAFLQLLLKVKVAQLCLTLCDPMDYTVPGDSSLSLFQGIFLTQESNPGLQHCRWILYQLSHKGSPRIVEWVAYTFSNRSSQPRNQTRVFCIASGFTNWDIREALDNLLEYLKFMSTSGPVQLMDPLSFLLPPALDHTQLVSSHHKRCLAWNPTGLHSHSWTPDLHSFTGLCWIFFICS